MSKEKIINSIVREEKIASILIREVVLANKVAIEFDTKEEKEEYIKEHEVRPTTKLLIDTKSDKSNSEGQESKKEKKTQQTQSKKIKYPNMRRISKKELETTLSKGYYTIISAGKNPDDPKESGLSEDSDFFKKRQESLQNDLEKSGVKYTEVIGQYKGSERSFMVLHEDNDAGGNGFMTHFKDAEQAKKMRGKLNDLGKKYNQNSVLHGDNGNNFLHFTAGKHKGKECGGSGWNYSPKASDFYTKIDLSNKKHTKFQMDISGCFSGGFFD